MSKILRVKGKNLHYPQWEIINIEMQEQFQTYHKELRDQGYEIKAVNIVKKEDVLYWILMGENGPYIEAYGRLVNGDTVESIKN